MSATNAPGMAVCCQRNVFVATESLTSQVRALEARLAAAPEVAPAPVGSDLAAARAERDAARDELGKVLRILRRDGGYRTPRDQGRIRNALAVFAELGGKFEDEP